MKYFINAKAFKADNDTGTLVILAEDGREYTTDKKTADADALAAFIDAKKHGKAEFWGFDAEELWAAMRETYSLPKTYHDLKDWHEELGSPTLPAAPYPMTPPGQHARWNMDVWSFLNRYAGQVEATEGEEEEEPHDEEHVGKRKRKSSRRK